MQGRASSSSSPGTPRRFGAGALAQARARWSDHEDTQQFLADQRFDPNARLYLTAPFPAGPDSSHRRVSSQAPS